MRPLAAIVVVVATATGVQADEIYLRGGGRITGILVEQASNSVEVEVGAGRVAVPRSQVERIVSAPSALGTFQTRASSLAPNDVTGWLALADWAKRADLQGQARDAYAHVLEIAPDNATAHRAVGHRLVGDRWLTRDEAFQAEGYVQLDGDWVTPEQRDAVLAERAAAQREHLEAARQRAALEEAEAKAREAEARARAAEADAARASVTYVQTVPTFGVVGVNPFVPYSPFGVRPDRCRHGAADGADGAHHRRRSIPSTWITFGP